MRAAGAARDFSGVTSSDPTAISDLATSSTRAGRSRAMSAIDGSRLSTVLSPRWIAAGARLDSTFMRRLRHRFSERLALLHEINRENLHRLLAGGLRVVRAGGVDERVSGLE